MTGSASSRWPHLRHRRPRAQHPHRSRRPGLAGPRLLHGDRGLHRRRPRRRGRRRPDRLRPADAGSGCPRRPRRRPGRALIAPDRGAGPRAVPGASSPSAWSSSAILFGNTSWGRRIAGDPGLGREFPGSRSGCGRKRAAHLRRERRPLAVVRRLGRAKRTSSWLSAARSFIADRQEPARTRTGRALQAIRDRDIAAEVMGVNEFRYKLMAFAISSFFAGIAGALLAAFAGRAIRPVQPLPLRPVHRHHPHRRRRHRHRGLLGTSSSSCPGVRRGLAPDWLADRRASQGGIIGAAAPTLLSTGPGDFGLVSHLDPDAGPGLNVFTGTWCSTGC